MGDKPLPGDVLWLETRGVLIGMSTSRPAADDPGRLAADAASALLDRTGRSLPVLYATQVHGTVGYSFGAHAPLAPEVHHVGRCDALFTDEEDVALLVRTADCLPMAFVAPGAIALIHAGWRGLAADIIAVTLRRMWNEYGEAPDAMDVVIGPAIGPCHYTVGTDVLNALDRVEVGSVRWSSDGRADLRAWAKGRLAVLGVDTGRIVDDGTCTACDPRLASYRRDGAASGRQWTVITRLRSGA